MADFIVGFYNEHETEDLILEWGNSDLSIKVQAKPRRLAAAIGNHPFWLSKAIYQDFKIIQTSHEKFNIIYVWSPPVKTDIFTIKCEDTLYQYKNGSFQKQEHPEENSIDFNIGLHNTNDWYDCVVD